MRRHLAITAPLALVLLCSCSAEDDRIPVFPVQGQVLYQGQPAAGALVIFNPAEPLSASSITPSGTVQSDGTFQLTSYETADGAPAGLYHVTLRWPQPPENPLEPPDMGPDRLENRFIDPAASPWRIEVVAGANVLEPIRIDG